jgi:hypothetical protein
MEIEIQLISSEMLRKFTVNHHAWDSEVMKGK